MTLIARLLILSLILGSAVSFAQIPPQTPRGNNPNTQPPPGVGGFNRPGATRPGPNVPGRPAAAAPGENPDQRPAVRAEDAITPDGGVIVQFPSRPITEVLLLYEDLTGLKIIRDAAAEQATVSIETTGELTKERAIMFIEKSLLLNGYSFVPSGEGMVKLLSEGKKPQTEGAPLFESASDLPETDQVVSYVALLKYLKGEDAIKAIDQVIPRHSYGVLHPVPNAKALVIVEASHTVRAILNLLERLDNKPAETLSKTFQLVRSDAEDIKKALDEILGTDEKGDNANGGRNPNIPQPQQPAVPQQALVPSPLTGVAGNLEDIPPKIISIPRRNCLMVIASPETMQYIGTIIEELDGASEIRNFVSRTLNYLGVESAMSIISDAISRSEGEEGSGGGGVNSLGQSNSTGTQNNNRNNTNTSSGFGSNSFGSNSTSGIGSSNSGLGGGSSSGLGGGTSGASANLQSLRPDNGPRSLVVGKTLLISDPTANSIFASGPPEHLRVLNEIIDELDKRPQQIFISVVVGEMTLGNGTGFSLDTILRGALIRNNASSNAGGIIRGSDNPILDPRTPLTTTANNITTSALEGLGSGLTLYGGLADGVDIIVSTLETNNNFKVLSRPTIFTMNNRAATITSGISIPVATSTQGLLTGGTTGNNSSGLISNVQYQPVVLSLQILPLINSEDELTLQISQENNEASETRTEISGNEYPELSQQTLNTTVLVKNRATVLLGGLIRESKNKSKSGLPFLSRIPGLGALTGSQSSSVTRRELLIFIQPRIVTSNYDLPPTVEDSPGSSDFGGEVRGLLNQEKTIQLKEADRENRSSKIGSMIKKLFQRPAKPETAENAVAAPQRPDFNYKGTR